MPSPLPRVCLPLTIPASWVYRGAIALRNRRYDRTKAHRVGVPVISVGNITTGGVGKSPMVAWIARLLLEHGRHPAICMRGYGSTPTQPSDEQMEYEAALPEVPVITHPDRVTAATNFLKQKMSVDCLLLDDGFQHRRMHRDLDLVLLDASANTLNDRLLPAGHLREPPTSLRRADAVIVTHSGRDSGGHSGGMDARLAEDVAKLHGSEPLAWTRHTWTTLQVIDGSAEHCQSTLWLAGKRVLTVLGVGNPQAVREQVATAGAMIARDLPVKDHQRYDRRMIDAMRAAANGLDATVVTGKDWVKLRSVLDLHEWPTPLVVPVLELTVFDGREELARLILSTVDHCERSFA